MNMVEKEKDLIGFAQKVISFRMNVIKACKAKGIDVPTDEQIGDYINDYGLHFEDFMADYTEHEGMFRCFDREQCINGMKPLVRNACLATIEKLSIERLVLLWNVFIEESGVYGEDSYIYDLTNELDVKTLDEGMSDEEILAVSKLVTKKNVRYIQWLNLNDNSIIAKSDEDIKNTIVGYWSEIFERIMEYPSAYDFEFGDEETYFFDVLFPIMTKELGY